MRGSSYVTVPEGTLAVPFADPQSVEALAAFGRFASARGWLAATSGNFSSRLDAGHALVTRSGIDKGAIRAADVAVVPLAGPIPAGMSAETPLHLARYRADAQIGAIVHVHTVAATVLSRAELAAGFVRFTGFEMHEGAGGNCDARDGGRSAGLRQRPRYRRTRRHGRSALGRQRHNPFRLLCWPDTDSTPGARP